MDMKLFAAMRPTAGFNAGNKLTTGSDNVVVGFAADTARICFGQNALLEMTTGSGNVALRPDSPERWIWTREGRGYSVRKVGRPAHPEPGCNTEGK
jgi:hypothetical protein